MSEQDAHHGFLDQKFVGTLAYHPGKLTWNAIMEVDGRLFSFANGVIFKFQSLMLRGVIYLFLTDICDGFVGN